MAAGAHHTPVVDDYVALDIETLNVEPGSPIIDLGLVRVRGGREVDSLELHPLGWSLRDIPYGHPTARGLLVATHGRAVAADRDLGECLRRLHAYVGDDVLVGQNIAGFDIKRINLMSANHGLAPLGNPHVDMLPLARRLYPHFQNHRLETLAAHHGLGHVAHTALADARQEHLLYERMKADVPAGGLPAPTPRPRRYSGSWRR